MWSWEDLGKFTAVFTLLCVSFVILSFIFSDKEVEFCYIDSMGVAGLSEVASVTGVYAHRSWWLDDLVYQSTDPEKTLQFLNRANAELRIAKKERIVSS